MSEPAGLYGSEDTVAETLAIEQRLRDGGYATLPDVLRLGGDFDFEGTTVDEILDEVQRYLLHQQTVELSGATILAAIGETAVKSQALDAIAALLRKEAHSGRTRRP